MFDDSEVIDGGSGIYEIVTKTTQAIAAYKVGKEIYKDAKAFLRNRNRKIITIAFDDDIFWKVAEYLRQNAVGDTKKKNLRSSSSGFTVNFRNSDSFIVTIDGHEVKVSVVEDHRSESREAVVSAASVKFLEFSCEHEIAATRVEAWLEGIRNSLYSETELIPSIYISDTWSDWERFGNIPQRPIETVVLKEGQAERLIADIDRFTKSEELYIRNGIPYHRGYLLYGPPGTGKTSLIIALARHFKRHVCFLTTADLKNERSINNLFAYVPANSFVVLEDVDTSFAVQDRKQNDSTKNERHLLSLMLNSLDGLTTPNGMILFMTTNKLDVIDDAILRPGRVDIKEYVGYLDTDQLCRMVSHFTGRPFEYNGEIEPLNIAPSNISELFKAYLDKPTEVESAIRHFIESKAKIIHEVIELTVE